MINYTYDKNNLNRENSVFIKYLNGKDFRLSDYSTEATINVPNRIQVYSSSDYEKTYN